MGGRISGLRHHKHEPQAADGKPAPVGKGAGAACCCPAWPHLAYATPSLRLQTG